MLRLLLWQAAPQIFNIGTAGQHGPDRIRIVAQIHGGQYNGLVEQAHEVEVLRVTFQALKAEGEPRQGEVTAAEVGLQTIKPFPGCFPSFLVLPPVPDSAPTGPSLADFACFYLYGLTNQPYRQSADLGKFGDLFSLAVGNHGGLGIASSFHPYQLVNPAGISVWYAAYAQFYAQPNRIEMFGAMTLEKTQFVVVPPASFAEFHPWPDSRLTTDENPIFSRFIPFVIPFLVRKDPDALRWDAELAIAEDDKNRLSAYLQAVNEAIQFVQPAPAFVLGFGEFDEQQPEQLIEKFLSCRNMLL